MPPTFAHALLGALLVPLAAAPLLAGPPTSGAPAPVVGDYVEARTAEVFAGGCIMNSEAETMGKEAVLAWRIARGSYQGVALDGLAVVAAVAADRNLGIREMGGEAPTAVRGTIVVDARASAAQSTALVSLVGAMTRGLVTDLRAVEQKPIRFADRGDLVEVEAGEARLQVNRKVTHSASCGAMQWFQPLAAGADAAVAMTNTQAYRGAVLGTRWQQVDKKSAFVGRFAFQAR